jgi:hypothetical protein
MSVERPHTHDMHTTIRTCECRCESELTLLCLLVAPFQPLIRERKVKKPKAKKGVRFG